MDAHLGYDKHSTMATILSWIDLTDMSFFPELVTGSSKLELSEEKGSTKKGEADTLKPNRNQAGFKLHSRLLFISHN